MRMCKRLTAICCPDEKVLTLAARQDSLGLCAQSDMQRIRHEGRRRTLHRSCADPLHLSRIA